MKFIKNWIKNIKQEWQIRKSVKLLNRKYDQEEVALMELEEAQKVPTADFVRARDMVAGMLRQDSERYHRASMKFLQENPDKDFVDFDQLDYKTKVQYFKNG